MDKKKITKATAWNIVKEIVAASGHADKDLLIEKIDNELAILAKKNAGEKKLTPQQTANLSIQENVLATMNAEPTRLFTITELTKEVPNLPEDMTPQRMSALVRQLKEAGKVERIEEKRKAYFRIPQ
jgi:DNA-binding transcriptional ArsR family regulator